MPCSFDPWESIKTFNFVKRNAITKYLFANKKQCLSDFWNVLCYQQKDATRENTYSLAAIHTRYQRVLQILKENNCSMANAFGCPRSTLRDFVAIAESRIVDEREFESASREICVGSVKELRTVCRRRLRRHLSAIAKHATRGTAVAAQIWWSILRLKLYLLTRKRLLQEPPIKIKS